MIERVEGDKGGEVCCVCFTTTTIKALEREDSRLYRETKRRVTEETAIAGLGHDW